MNKISVNGTNIYVTPTGLKVGNSRNRVTPTGQVLGILDKGEARKLRKALRSAGHLAKASAPRVAVNS